MDRAGRNPIRTSPFSISVLLSALSKVIHKTYSRSTVWMKPLHAYTCFQGCLAASIPTECIWTLIANWYFCFSFTKVNITVLCACSLTTRHLRRIDRKYCGHCGKRNQIVSSPTTYLGQRFKYGASSEELIQCSIQRNYYSTSTTALGADDHLVVVDLLVTNPT